MERSGPTAFRGSFTQTPDRKARRTWRALLGGRSGKKRTYGLTRVVYPDPRSRGEKGVLGRHEEPCVMRSVRCSDRELLVNAETESARKRERRPSRNRNNLRRAALSRRCSCRTKVWVLIGLNTALTHLMGGETTEGCTGPRGALIFDYAIDPVGPPVPAAPTKWPRRIGTLPDGCTTQFIILSCSSLLEY